MEILEDVDLVIGFEPAQPLEVSVYGDSVSFVKDMITILLPIPTFTIDAIVGRTFDPSTTSMFTGAEGYAPISDENIEELTDLVIYNILNKE